ncbi:RluA family pseudouridine synthase [Limosilactobacillus gastricus]|uniref:Pseudouridine synthase n=1 Tax=Limosilactobacillus gastricus DSM 16045 TaxID=1423749 RepID=A0A0R1VE19_9LACO|nr:RluA family pseudouridine synthase [Limosilactobacillus gastricus]KRM01283.1 Pseudouridine synthase [Limosilactobacillus gastricus DSM 16045]QGF40900.1 RluA family pseudouridine synthase [Limosilactobacillus gastricus]
MENTWVYRGTEPIKIKQYLHSLGMGHRLFNDIKNGQGEFLVDHRPVRPTTKILPNQPLTIKVQPEPIDPTVQVSTADLSVVYEDDNWLVVNKPAGVSSVPGPTQPTDTILNRVTGYLRQGQSPDQRPHLVTRLDRYTSGLMLIAKHNVATSMISPQVQTHQMLKEYLAVVQGRLPETHQLITSPIARVVGQAQRVVDPDGQKAETEYWVEETKGDYSLVRLQLHSGRTHQIRVHLSSIGYPIVGDALYGGDCSIVDHQLLQAFSLAFVDPFSEEQRTFELPMDERFNQIWTN